MILLADDKKKSKSEVTRGEFAEGIHEARPIEEADDNAYDIEYVDDPEAPKHTVAQLEVTE